MAADRRHYSRESIDIEASVSLDGKNWKRLLPLLQ
jgi:hypothetical protein